jgi:tripeptide aminopeptidase
MDEELLVGLERRLLAYARIDTQSDAASKSSPSTEKQFDLLHKLQRELAELGAQDITLTGYGALLATIPATTGAAVPTVALLAHVDTAPQFTGADVKPLVHRNYQGGPIILPDDPSQMLTVEKFPYLGKKIGEHIVTTSGTTLLGGDDKAGVAIVMETARRLLSAKGALKHGKVRLCFTPDEEIGRGVNPALPKDLGADVAYTLDGADAGEIVFETFSADQAVVRIEGVPVHPGWAKDKLVNALHLMAKVIDTLPHATLTPETTDGRQGFIHVVAAGGTAAAAEITLILRDFEVSELERHGALVQAVCAAVQASEPRAKITCEITTQYRNMRYWLENDMRPVELARAACRAVGVEPFSAPIRGGTDGSRLTEMGVPTPNLFTGMQEIHGPLEWISLHDMARATLLCEALVQLWAESSPAKI